MKITCRRYQAEEDFWRMRAFLREVFMLNGRLERSWHVARLDYARFHVCMNCHNTSLDKIAWLWELGGKLIAFTMPDGGFGEAHFCVHPEYDSPTLAEEMLDIAEQYLAEVKPDGSRSFCVWAPEIDKSRHDLFIKRGYRLGDWPETQWNRDLDTAILDAPIPPGFTIRALGDGLELLERCYASGLGFHKGDIKIAVENREDPTWYRNIQTAPLYRRDLDLIVLTNDGSIAAFCTIWFDDVTRSAYFEPVATIPAYQKRGLGKALLTEGLRRLQRMGTLRAFVSGYSQAANSLYGSVFGPKHEVYQVWEKIWTE